MNPFSYIRTQVLEAVNALQKSGELPADLPLDAIACESPRDAAHGDIAVNAAMVLAKPAKMNPRALAEKFVAVLSQDALVKKAEIAGPGFINLTLSESAWQKALAEIQKQSAAYGACNLGKGKKVNLEYVSANPTGPMHVGHARGAVYGDILGNLLEKAGYNVTREYYINDAGAQVDTLARSAHLRYREALGETVTIPEGLYPGEYLKPVGEALKKKFGEKYKSAPESDWLQIFRSEAVAAMMDLIREDLEIVGVKHDVFSSERALVEAGKVQEGLDVLTQLGLIYEGVLEPPKGKKPEDWEPRPQTLFKATQFGDDVDRPLKKSDGSWTYFASDVAYHLDKYRRGFADMIVVLGSDHGGYQKRLEAVVKALSGGKAQVNTAIYQIVNFTENGQPVKMSKRAGTFLTIRDVVEAVGKDVVRFMMLTRKNTEILDFDFTKVKEQSKDNPVFYVQYAHARICSVLRNAAAEGFSADGADLALLNHPAELGVIKKLCTWPRLVETAAKHQEPHRIAFYLHELAAEFHALWNLGRGEENLRFILPENPALTKARLAFISAVAIVITSGLSIFGVTPAETM